MNGQAFGPLGGFSVFFLNAGGKPHKIALISAGVGNLFNRTHAEFLPRTGSSLPGLVFPPFPPNTRIDEPGRTFWLKAQIAPCKPVPGRRRGLPVGAADKRVYLSANPFFRASSPRPAAGAGRLS